MATDQKLEIEIALRDSVSLSLRAMAKNLDDLNAKLRQAGAPVGESLDTIKKLEQTTNQFKENVKQGNKDVQSITESLKSVLSGKAIGGIIGGVATLAYETTKGAFNAITNLSDERMRLKHAALDSVFTEEQIRILERTGERMGMTADQSQKNTAQIGHNLRELKAYGTSSEIFKRLNFFGETEFGFLIKQMVESGRAGEVIPAAVKHYEDLIRSGNTRQAERFARAMQMTEGFLQNYNASVQGVTAGFISSAEASEKWLADLAKQHAGYATIRSVILSRATKVLNEATESLKELEKQISVIQRPDLTDPAARAKIGLPPLTPAQLEHIKANAKERGEILKQIDKVLKDLKDQQDRPPIEGRQMGGLVQAGRLYRVSERGPEGFSPYGGPTPPWSLDRPMFRPPRGGYVDPFSGVTPDMPGTPFELPPVMGENERRAVPGDPAATWEALNEALKKRPGIGYPEHINPQGPGSGSNLFGDPLFGSLREQERQMEGRLQLPWWMHDDRPTPPAQQTNFRDTMVGGSNGSGASLGAEINFRNVPPGVRTNADSDGFDSFTVNSQRAL